jgi:hypothetical protein
MRARVAVGIFVAVTLFGCNRVQGSCDRRATGDGTCEEITMSTIKDSQAYECRKSDNALRRGTWTEKKACDHTGAIGACETSQGRTWYYPSGRVTKIEHVAQLCSMGKVLDGTGKQVKNVAPEALADGPRADPGLDAIAAPFKAALEANIAAVEKIRMGGATPGTVRLTGGKHVTAGSNAAAVWWNDVSSAADHKIENTKWLPFSEGDDLQSCAYAVRTHDRSGRSDDEMKRLFKWCAGLTVLLVVQYSKLENPSSRSGSDFFSGKLEGTVHVYELPSGKLAGGYPFKAESSDKVKSNQLMSDFMTNVDKSLTTGLAKADPGATFAFSVKPDRT